MRLLTSGALDLDWTQEETEVPGDNTHLWEESWDDDDTSEDFSAQLK
jgi:26 proteasome complex subunit DSS1